MVTNNKVLTVSYGTFSCTLEGFDDSFETMKAIAEYFRDLAADDRYFGAEPPTPDAETMARIAEREIDRRVQARTDTSGALVLTASDAIADAPEEAPVQSQATEAYAAPVAEEVAETPAMDEDALAQEREAFFAEVDTVASEHAQDVAEDVSSHELDDAVLAAVQEDLSADVDTNDAPVEDEAEEIEAAIEDALEEEIEDEIEDVADVELAEAEEAPAEDVAEPEVADVEPVAAAPVAEVYEDHDADDFFSGTKAAEDAGVTSIAAKLSRIRAVVAKAEDEDAASTYSEDEHANSAESFLRKSANDIEESLEDEDDVDQEPQAVKPGRVIRMRRSERPVQDAPEAPMVLKQPIQPEPETQLEPEVQPEPEVDVAPEPEASFDTQYEEVALEDEVHEEELVEEVEEPVPAPQPRRLRRRSNLAEEAPQEESMDRLLDETNSKLAEPEAKGRRSALAHLRAAVAATRAEKSAGTYEEPTDQSDAYREDLANVMRPARVAAEPAGHDEGGASPLRLVASQRVDAPQEASDPSEAVRPRRVSPADIASFEPQDANDFAEYAEQVGASELPDILEAAASYLTYVEGRRRFSRPMLMRLAYQLGPDRFQREAGLRSFGQLLRDKKIEKIAGGRFTAADTIRFKPESAAG